jgi:hypothetical protein
MTKHHLNNLYLSVEVSVQFLAPTALDTHFPSQIAFEGAW